MLLVAANEPLPVREARSGCAEAWNTIFKRYQLPLYVYVYELVHHEQESLDIVQETFINAARHIGSLRDDAKFGSWLFGIAHQKCIQHWRRHDRRQLFTEQDSDAISEHPEVSGEDGPFELLLRKEQEEEFLSILARLPHPQRSVLLLHFVEEFSLDEIAGITETSLGTVKSRMHYAKRALKKLMEEKRT